MSDAPRLGATAQRLTCERRRPSDVERTLRKRRRRGGSPGRAALALGAYARSQGLGGSALAQAVTPVQPWPASTAAYASSALIGIWAYLVCGHHPRLAAAAKPFAMGRNIGVPLGDDITDQGNKTLESQNVSSVQFGRQANPRAKIQRNIPTLRASRHLPFASASRQPRHGMACFGARRSPVAIEPFVKISRSAALISPVPIQRPRPRSGSAGRAGPDCMRVPSTCVNGRSCTAQPPIRRSPGPPGWRDPWR